MTRHRLKGVIGAFVASSVLLSSAAAAAPTNIPVQQANPWVVLSAMSDGAPAAALCGAAVAAAQTPTGCVLPALDAAPAAAPAPAPVPPVAAPSGGLGISPLLLAALVIAAGVGIYFAVHHHHHHHHANSPA